MAFVLVPQPVLTTSTYVVAWPQGDQLLGGGPWHKANLPATHWLSLPFYTPEGASPLSPLAFISRLVVERVPTRPEGRLLAPSVHPASPAAASIAKDKAEASAAAAAKADASAMNRAVD